MPAHIKTMLTATSLQVPVLDGELALGTWQAIYLIEHRARPHRREIVLQFIGGNGDTSEAASRKTKPAADCIRGRVLSAAGSAARTSIRSP